MHVDSTLLESEIRRGVNYQKQQVRSRINSLSVDFKSSKQIQFKYNTRLNFNAVIFNYPSAPILVP